MPSVGQVMHPFFSIGHSNRRVEEFVDLLRHADVACVVDIRKVPRSGSNPQFNGEALAQSLSSSGISYQHLAELGGLRGRDRSVSRDVNALWTNESFHNYADYALSAPFHAGLERLREEGRKRRCAFMCSEAVWWRCHRRIVSDYLIASGETVVHVMGMRRLEPARLTPGARVQPDGTILYPVG